MQCKTTGDVLRKLRLECGLTQQAVADALHVNRATYTYHESDRTIPDIQRIGELAKIFGIPTETLVELLSDPSKVEAASPKRRPGKKVSQNPGKLGQLRPEEKSLISLFRRCDEQGRRAIRSYSEKMSREGKDSGQHPV